MTKRTSVEYSDLDIRDVLAEHAARTYGITDPLVEYSEGFEGEPGYRVVSNTPGMTGFDAEIMQVLHFYGDAENWQSSTEPDGAPGTAIDADQGRRAQDMLRKLRGLPPKNAQITVHVENMLPARFRGRKVLGTHALGKTFRKYTKIDVLDRTGADLPIHVYFPPDTILTGKFFQGFMGPSIGKLGAEEFRRRYRFYGTNMDHVVADGIRTALMEA